MFLFRAKSNVIWPVRAGNIAKACERNFQHAAHRDPDRLAVERITARLVEQHSCRAKGSSKQAAERAAATAMLHKLGLMK